MPTVYHLATDYARFGLTKAQADEILSHRFTRRVDNSANLTGRPRVIVLHIQEGTTPGSLSWWARPDAASASVMSQRDGSLLTVIDPQHGPWTNGDVNKPSAKGQRVVGWGGNPNVWTLSIEAEGHPNDAMPEAQLAAIEWQCREWMKTYNLTTNDILRHADINSVTRPYCPGNYYAEILRRLNADQPSTTPSPHYVDADIPAFCSEEELAKGIDRTLNGVKVWACHREVTVDNRTPRRQYATLDAAHVGNPLLPGEKFKAEFTFRTRDGWWWLTRWGTRVFASDCSPTVRFE